jgi:hypothetical protein
MENNNNVKVDDSIKLPDDHPLKPFEPIIHRELSLEEISNLQNGICLKMFEPENPDEGGLVKTNFETMESTYLLSCLKEKIANGEIDKLTHIRIYQECSTFTVDEIKELLKDYKIPENHLRFRNGDPNYPDIDEDGNVIERKNENE